MIDASPWLEWPLLVALIVAACFAALSLTARAVGGWRQLLSQPSSPDVPTRYLVLMFPAIVVATVLIDPLGSLSGSGWIWDLSRFLVLFAGSLWWFRVVSNRSNGDDAEARFRAGQRRLAWTAILSAAVLTAIGMVVLAEGNLTGGLVVLGVVAASLSLMGLAWWRSRRG